MEYKDLKGGDVKQSGDQFTPKGMDLWDDCSELLLGDRLLPIDITRNNYRRPIKPITGLATDEQETYII